MKRFLLCLTLLSTIADNLLAQSATDVPTKRIGFGVFAGLNRAYPIIRGGPVHYQAQNALLLGVDLNYRLNPRTYLHVQPSWTRLSDIYYKLDFDPLAFRANLNTLRIPVTVRYYVLPKSKFLFLEGGLGYNQLLTSYYASRQVICPIAPPCFDVDYELNPVTRMAVSGLAGLGVNINIQKISLPVTLRYERFLSGYEFGSRGYDDIKNPVKFESFVITTGVNF